MSTKGMGKKMEKNQMQMRKWNVIYGKIKKQTLS